MISFLKHNNARTVCPPGKLPKGSGRNVLVASLTRSGTHVLIDMLLNNFKCLRNAPLYVDLDMWLRKGNSLEELAKLEGVIFKTHYPQDELPITEDEFNVFLSTANPIIVATQRDSDSVFKSASSSSFPRYTERDEFDRDVRRHHLFWESKIALTLPLDKLLQQDSYRLLLQKLEVLLKKTARKNPIFPRAKHAKNRVLCDKLFTRIMGKNAKSINTTVGFAKK